MIYTKLYDLRDIELDDAFITKAKNRVIESIVEKTAAETSYGMLLAYKARTVLNAMKIENGSIFQVNFKDVGLVSFKFIALIENSSSYYSYQPTIKALRKLKSGKWSKVEERISIDEDFPAWITIPPTSVPQSKSSEQQKAD